MAEKAEILEALRPIFPQLNDVIIGNCIDRVREMLGNVERGFIIPSCIDMLLVADPNQDAPPPPRNDDRERDFIPATIINFQDDIPDIELLQAVADLPGSAASINSSLSDSFEYFDPDESDDDLVYISAKARDGKDLLFVDDDSQPQVAPLRMPNRNAGVIKTTGLATPVIDLSQKTAGPVTITIDKKPSPLVRNFKAPNQTTSTPSRPIASTSTPTSTESRPLEIPKSAPNWAPIPPPPPPPPPPVPVITDPIGYAVKEIKGLFSDVQDNYIRELLQPWASLPPVQIITNACNHLLENKGYPKQENKPVPIKAEKTVTAAENVNYFKDYKSQVPYKSRSQCEQLLENEFPMVSVRDVRSILAKYNYHYAPARKTLEESLVYACYSPSPSKNGTSSTTPSKMMPPSSAKTPLPAGITPLKLLKSRRSKRHISLLQNLELDLQQEIAFIKQHKRSETEEGDRKLALELNEKQYVEEGQTIECGCCYGDAAFEHMVQCLDGHLFCEDCLRNYAKESVFGQGKATLSCMTAECDSTFPMSQLKKTLPSNILEKYEDRLQEESLCLAEMEDLVRCPSCDFAALVPPGNKVFKCQNTTCGKEICRFCKEDWSEHFGLKCSEIEKKGEKDIRLSYEEKMTMAKIRKCHKCGCEFTKSDGCNKMTCRCGTTQCYVCRKPGISYNHFCQHARDPGKGCTRCKSCSLWTDPSEDDNMAVRQLEQEAKEVKRQMDTKEESEVPAKRPKIS